MIISGHGRVITALYMDHPVQKIAYQRVLEVLVICAGGTLYCYGVADFELANGPPQIISKFDGQPNSPWVTVTSFSLECEEDIVEDDWMNFTSVKNRKKTKLLNPILFIAGSSTGLISSLNVINGTIIHSGKLYRGCLIIIKRSF